MSSPTSIRFDEHVLERLRSYVAAHPGLSTSGAANQLIDEALRSREHPLIVFHDGPLGRRARLAGGPDVWEVIRAVRSAQRSEPDLSPQDILELVAETAGLSASMVSAAVAYWSDYPDEIEAVLQRVDEETARAHARWERERELLG